MRMPRPVRRWSQIGIVMFASALPGEFAAQQTVVDIYVSGRVLSAHAQTVRLTRFGVVANPSILAAIDPKVFRSPERVAARDTMRLETPANFSVDLQNGEVLLLSESSSWLSVEVLLADGGTIKAAGKKLRVSLQDEGRKIEVRGVP